MQAHVKQTLEIDTRRLGSIVVQEDISDGELFAAFCQWLALMPSRTDQAEPFEDDTECFTRIVCLLNVLQSKHQHEDVLDVYLTRTVQCVLELYAGEDFTPSPLLSRALQPLTHNNTTQSFSHLLAAPDTSDDELLRICTRLCHPLALRYTHVWLRNIVDALVTLRRFSSLLVVAESCTSLLLEAVPGMGHAREARGHALDRAMFFLLFTSSLGQPHLFHVCITRLASALRCLRDDHDDEWFGKMVHTCQILLKRHDGYPTLYSCLYEYLPAEASERTEDDISLESMIRQTLSWVEGEWSSQPVFGIIKLKVTSQTPVFVLHNRAAAAGAAGSEDRFSGVLWKASEAGEHDSMALPSEWHCFGRIEAPGGNRPVRIAFDEHFTSLYGTAASGDDTPTNMVGVRLHLVHSFCLSTATHALKQEVATEQARGEEEARNACHGAWRCDSIDGAGPRRHGMCGMAVSVDNDFFEEFKEDVEDASSQDRSSSSGGETVLVFGGVSDRLGQITDDVSVFDPVSSMWRSWVPREGQAWPCARKSAAFAGIDQRYLVVFGGIDAEFNFLDDMWILDVPRRQWHHVPRHKDWPTARLQGQLAFDSDSRSLWLYGGLRKVDGGVGETSYMRDVLFPQRVLSDTWRFQLHMSSLLDDSSAPQAEAASINSWHRVYPGGSRHPGARFAHSLTYAGDGNVLLFGGVHSDSGKHSCSELWRLDTRSSEWYLVQATGPSRRSMHSAAGFNGDLYVFGGLADLSHGQPLNDCWRFDTSRQRWDRVLPLGYHPHVRCDSVLVASTAALHLFGGAASCHSSVLGNVSSDLHSFTRELCHGPAHAEEDAGHKSSQPSSPLTMRVPSFMGLRGHIDLAALSSFRFGDRKAFTVEAWVKGDASPSAGQNMQNGVASPQLQTVVGAFDSPNFKHWRVFLKHGKLGVYRNSDPCLVCADLPPSRKHSRGDDDDKNTAAEQEDVEEEEEDKRRTWIREQGFVHVAMSYDGGTMRVYVNGRLTEEETMGATGASLHRDRMGALIGASSQNHALMDGFNGFINEVRLWSVPRSPLQIQANLYTSLQGTEADLLAYYPLRAVVERTGVPRKWILPSPGALDHSSPAHVHHGVLQHQVAFTDVPSHALPVSDAPARSCGSPLFFLHGSARHDVVSGTLTFATDVGGAWYRHLVQVEHGFESSVNFEWDGGCDGGFSVVLRGGSLMSQKGCDGPLHALGLEGLRSCVVVSVVRGASLLLVQDSAPQCSLRLTSYDSRGSKTLLDEKKFAVFNKGTLAVLYNNAIGLKAAVVPHDGHNYSAVVAASHVNLVTGLRPVVAGRTGVSFMGLIAAVPAQLTITDWRFQANDKHEVSQQLLAIMGPIAVDVDGGGDGDGDGKPEMLDDATSLRVYSRFAAEHLNAEDVATATQMFFEYPEDHRTSLMASYQAALKAEHACLPLDVQTSVAHRDASVTVLRESGSANGMWDTNLGCFSLLQDQQSQLGYHLSATYADKTHTALRAVMFSTKRGGFDSVGFWKERPTDRAWKPLRMVFDASWKSLRGAWFNKEKSAEFQATKQPHEVDMGGSQAKLGLVNLGNTCYLSSFAQSLFMTAELREQVLKAHTTPFPQEEGEATVAALQRLFVSLALLQRDSVNPHSFQQSLSAQWKAPGQQDSSEFGSFLLEKVEEGLQMIARRATQQQQEQQPSSPSQPEQPHEPVSSLFRGQTETVRRCSKCGAVSSSREPFVNINLPFVGKFAPVTGLAVIQDHDTPHGFSRIPTNINPGDGCVPTFVCVSRACCQEPPVTSVKVLYGSWEWEEEEEEEEKDASSDRLATFQRISSRKARLRVPDVPESYELLPVDVNARVDPVVADIALHPPPVYLAYSRAPGSPITDLRLLVQRDADGRMSRDFSSTGVGGGLVSPTLQDSKLGNAQSSSEYDPVWELVPENINPDTPPPAEHQAREAEDEKEKDEDDKIMHLVEEDDDRGQQNVTKRSQVFLQLNRSGCPITDIEVASGFSESIFLEGFTRVETNLCLHHGGYRIDKRPPENSIPNLPGFAYLFFRRGASQPVTQLKVVDSDEEAEQKRSMGWTVKPLGVHRVDPAGDVDKRFYLCYAKADGSPITDVLAFRGHHTRPEHGDLDDVLSVRVQPQPVSRGIEGYWAVDSARLGSLTVRHGKEGETTQVFGVEGFLGEQGTTRVCGLLSKQESESKWRMSGSVLDKSRVVGRFALVFLSPGEFEGRVFLNSGPREWRGFRCDDLPASEPLRLVGKDGCVLFVDEDGCVKGRTPHAQQQACTALQHLNLPAQLAQHRLSTYEHFLVCEAFDDADAVCLKTGVDTYVGVFESGDMHARTKDLLSASKNMTLRWYIKEDADGFIQLTSVLGTVLTVDSGTGEVKGMYPDQDDGFPDGVCYLFRRDKVQDTGGSLSGIEGVFMSCFGAQESEPSKVTLRMTWAGVAQAVHVDASHGHSMSGLMYTSPQSPLELVVDGCWGTRDQTLGAMRMHARLGQKPVHSLRGSLNNIVDDSFTSFVAHRDDFLTVCCTRDYEERWEGGRQILCGGARAMDLQSIVQQFTKVQLMDGSNLYRCSSDACGDTFQRAEQSMRVTHAPSHLFLTLKRFAYDPHTQRKKKIFDEIAFPVAFQLPVHASASSQRECSLHDPADQVGYGLYAVIVHSGVSADVGHYYCFARDSHTSADLEQNDDDTNPWYKFDDQKVTRSSWRQIQRITQDAYQDSAYILLYKQSQPSSQPSSPPPSSHFSTLKLAPGVAEEVYRENMRVLSAPDVVSREYSQYVLSHFVNRLPPARPSLPLLTPSQCQQNSSRALLRLCQPCPLSCPCPLCRESVPVTRVSQHMLQECPRRVRRCPHCANTSLACDFPAHLQQCTRYGAHATRCPECRGVLRRSEFDEHQKQCTHRRHTRLSIQGIVQQQRHGDQLKAMEQLYAEERQRTRSVVSTLHTAKRRRVQDFEKRKQEMQRREAELTQLEEAQRKDPMAAAAAVMTGSEPFARDLMLLSDEEDDEVEVEVEAFSGECPLCQLHFDRLVELQAHAAACGD